MSDYETAFDYVVGHEAKRLGWMAPGPRKDQLHHMIKVNIRSLPYDELMDMYQQVKWSEDHGRIRVIQYVEVHEDTGAPILTRWMIEQNINGQWTKVPVTYVNEEE